MIWTDEKIACLIRGWNGDVPINDIAEQVGGARNAVIGKAHRLRHQGEALSDRAVGGSRPGRRGKPAASPAERVVEAWEKPPTETVPADALDVEEAEAEAESAEPESSVGPRKGLLDLEAGDCRWPIGDPIHGPVEFHFCGGPAVKGLPYCDSHARVAYRPSEAKARVTTGRPFVFAQLPSHKRPSERQTQVHARLGGPDTQTPASDTLFAEA